MRRRGLVALVAVVILWASYALTIRGIGESGLTSVDASFVRFVTPVIILAPWFPRAVRALRRERAGVVLALCLAGLPHYLLSALGGRLTSAALVGLLIPGSVPVFVAIIRAKRLPGRRTLALASIILGVAATTVLTNSAATIAGIGVLLAAGCAWAIYTVALPRTQLDLISLVLVVCTPSALAAVVLGVTGILPSNLLAGGAPISHIALFAALQGVGTGILSTLAYAYAVRTLGSSIPAATGAVSPVLTTLLAVPLFAEPITPGAAVALVLIVGGVIAFNRAPAQTPLEGSIKSRPETSARFHLREPEVGPREPPRSFGHAAATHRGR
jgi:drug/metabolite transporter (DMT)-like permease